MASSMLCVKCKTEMTKTGVSDSGNAKYVTYRCGGCRAEKTVCIGVNAK